MRQPTKHAVHRQERWLIAAADRGQHRELAWLGRRVYFGNDINVLAALFALFVMRLLRARHFAKSRAAFET